MMELLNNLSREDYRWNSLLAGQAPHLHRGGGRRARRAIAVFGFDSSSRADPPTPATSVVIISGDGMGVQQRTAIQYAGYGLDERQPMDALPYAGFLDTIQDGKAVTDSAAGATAWSIGVKTKNGLVGLGRDKVRRRRP